MNAPAHLPPVTVGLSDEALDVLADLVAAKLAQRQGAGRRWLTVDEAAVYIGAKPQRVYDLRSSGRLRRTGDGGRAMIDRRELDTLLERGTA